MNVIPSYTHLVLSGGGLQGISYIGVYRILKQYKLLEHVHHLIGCSIGAVFAYLYALNLEVEEMEAIFDKIFNDSTYTEFDAENIWCFMEKKGMYSVERFRNVLTMAFEMKYKETITTISFQEFSKLTGKNLYITSVSVSSMKTKVFSNIDTPNIDIFSAILASMAIPGFFQPVIIDNEFYIDGGIDNAIPLQCISYTSTDHVLAIYLKSIVNKTYQELQFSSIYFTHIITGLTMINATNAYLDIYKNHKNIDIMELDKNPLPFLPVQYLDTKMIVKLSTEVMEQGIFYGYSTAYQYFKNKFIDSPSQISLDSLPCD